MAIYSAARCDRCGKVEEYATHYTKTKIIQKIKELGWSYTKKKNKAEICICRACRMRR